MVMKHEEAIRWLKMQSNKPVKWDDYSEENKQIREEAERRMKEAFNMAIEALKTTEPRVMTLDKVQALNKDDVVWLEDKDKTNIIPGIVRNRHLWPHSIAMVTNFMRGDGCTVTAGDDDYGSRWRCWTSRPDEKRRAETPWN